ncbi:MAG: hypothetical protein KDD66_18470 [Bdellovibrionales bacterium]|nr:hypothetical protein [Bdellovibrionales bacterium]
MQTAVDLIGVIGFGMLLVAMILTWVLIVRAVAGVPAPDFISKINRQLAAMRTRRK